MKEVEPVTEFGRELRRLRREGAIKYSQPKLAGLAGVTASYISQLESGKKTNPTPSVVRRLSGHLGVRSNHLLSRIGTPEMDLAATLATKSRRIGKVLQDHPISLEDERSYIERIIKHLPADQLEEVAAFLAYLEFRDRIRGSSSRATYSSQR